ncbi:flotillin domain-containing protein, partial [Streptomyces sp. NPDC057746]|uniref:flotillin domain-containing protein n=1 Tax=Streptomyces sp. NPDC057746 TaxID=3346237 RepID=UPI003690E657
AERSRRAAIAEAVRLEGEAEAAAIGAKGTAEAERLAGIAAAQAEAERARLTGEGEKQRRSALAEAEAIEGLKQGEAERSRRAAIAEAVRLEGEAEAAAIGAKGTAEATAMEKKADAFDRYGDAAILQMLVEVLPQVVAKASEPLSAVDKMTVISTDGASRLSRTVADNVTQGIELLSSSTGVDLSELLKGITRRNSDTQSAATPTAVANGRVEIG